MIETIEKDFLEAYKAKNEVVLAVLRMLKSAINNKKIELKADTLADTDVVAIIKKEIKQRKDSIAQFQKGGREDLAAIEEAEIAVLEKYLPAEMADAEIERIVDGVISEINPQGPSDFGKVMGLSMQRIAGQADGAKVSEIVKQKLSNNG